MTRDDWKRDWRDVRLGRHLRPPAADLLFRRGLRDPLLLLRQLRPEAARWKRDGKYRRAAFRTMRTMIRESGKYSLLGKGFLQ